MKALDKRLRRLENRTFPPEDEERLRVVAQIRERQRRHFEADGRSFVEDDRPRKDLRGMTIAEIIRHRRFGRREALVQ